MLNNLNLTPPPPLACLAFFFFIASFPSHPFHFVFKQRRGLWRGERSSPQSITWSWKGEGRRGVRCEVCHVDEGWLITHFLLDATPYLSCPVSCLAFFPSVSLSLSPSLHFPLCLSSNKKKVRGKKGNRNKICNCVQALHIGQWTGTW